MSGPGDLGSRIRDLEERINGVRKELEYKESEERATDLPAQEDVFADDRGYLQGHLATLERELATLQGQLPPDTSLHDFTIDTLGDEPSGPVSIEEPPPADIPRSDSVLGDISRPFMDAGGSGDLSAGWKSRGERPPEQPPEDEPSGLPPVSKGFVDWALRILPLIGGVAIVIVGYLFLNGFFGAAGAPASEDEIPPPSPQLVATPVMTPAATVAGPVVTFTRTAGTSTNSSSRDCIAEITFAWEFTDIPVDKPLFIAIDFSGPGLENEDLAAQWRGPRTANRLSTTTHEIVEDAASGAQGWSAEITYMSIDNVDAVLSGDPIARAPGLVC